MCVFTAALVWLARGALAQRLRLQRTGMGIPALALLAIAAASTIRSPHPIASLATLLEWVSYAAVFAVIVNATTHGEGPHARLLLRLLWASAFVVCLYGLFQQFINLPLLKKMIEADSARVLGELRMSERHIGDLMARATGRIFSTFLLANSFAGFLALVVPGFLGYLLDRLRAGDRGAWLFGASGLWLAAALACLLLTYSKGGWVAFAIGMLAFGAMLGKDLLRRHKWLLAGAAAAAIGAVALLLAVKVVPTQIFRDFVTSFEIRTGYWQGALEMARDHPLGGVGLGAFGGYFPRYRALLAHPALDAHNDYLQVLAELGVPGLLIFLWLWAACLRNAFSIPRPPKHVPAAHPENRKPKTENCSSPRRLTLFAACAALVAFLLTTVVMATFSLAGWWDADPASQELKLWLDRALLVGFLACWLAFFAALGKVQAQPLGELCRKGLVCGMIAFLVHCAVDFDYQEPGVAFTAWVVAALSVEPRGEPIERRLSPIASIAIAAAAVLLMGAFQFVLWRATRAAADRDIASSLVSDAMRTAQGPERVRLLDRACERYEAAIEANPLDDSLLVEYGAFLAPTLDQSPAVRACVPGPGDVQRFCRAVELYARAAQLNRPWATPHVRLGALYLAAADPAAAPAAKGILQPLIPHFAARRPPTGPNTLYLPAVVEFEAALARDPRNPAVMLLVAEALEKHGDPKAAEAARKTLELAGILYRHDPGHKLCLGYEEAVRAKAIVDRAEAKGPSP